jgi:hypothetical protein
VRLAQSQVGGAWQIVHMVLPEKKRVFIPRRTGE